VPAAKFEAASTVATGTAPGEHGTARLFNLGRFSPKDKGQHLLLEALSGGEWRTRDWKLSFIGLSGFGADYLDRMACYFGIEPDRIEIVPFTDEVFAEIGKREVLLMPSLAEGTPYAMIESMACGRPAVGTPVGGIPELIDEGETGWLARTVDAADIADALERMWSARPHWASVGQAAAAKVRANNNEESVYAELIEALRADTR
jgi:glycosyltransferase involved in cell wall biosynthesis